MNIKNYIIAFALLLISLDGFAQKGMYAGGSLTIHDAALISTDNFQLRPGISYKRVTGYAFDVPFGYRFNDRLAIGSAVGFSGQGQSYTLKTSGYTCTPQNVDFVQLDVRLTYLQVPLNFYYSFIKRESISLSVFAGGEYGKLLIRDDNSMSLNSCFVEVSPPSKRYTNYDLAVTGGLQLDYNATEQIRYIAFARIDRGFRRVVTGDLAHSKLVEMYNSYNRTIGIGVGITYSFKKKT